MNKKENVEVAFETVQIPKATADYIREQDHFKIYSSLDSFVMDAVSLRLEDLKLKGIFK